MAEGVGGAVTSLEGFEVERILQDLPNTKSIFVLGRLQGQPAVVTLEKRPFSKDNIARLLSGETALTLELHNDIYSTYCACPPTDLNAVDMRLVWPATEKHVAKYVAQEHVLFRETPEFYRAHVEPYIQSLPKERIAWVYNILEGTKEADRVIFCDNNPSTGFVLLPDMKWNREEKDQLYCVAIILRRDIGSLRDLKPEHLPLLANVRDEGLAALQQTFGVAPESIRTYLHYHPSYYHLHIHFTHLHFDAPGTWAGKAHLLDDVMDNIRLDASHYQRRTLTCVLGKEHPVYKLAHPQDAPEAQ